MLPQRSDIETSVQGFTRLIWCTYREQNSHCNFPLFSHTVPSFDPGAVADGKGAGPSFLFFISFCCNFCATGTSKEGERRWGHNEKGDGRGHQRVREGIRWSSVAGITGGRGWNLTQQRWHAPPLPSSFIHLQYFSENVRRKRLSSSPSSTKYFLLLPMSDTIPFPHRHTRALLCRWGSGLRQCSTWPLRRKPLEKKLVRSPLGAVTSGKQWGPVGSQWCWTCLSRVSSDPCPQQKKTETWKWWTCPLEDQTPTPLSKQNKVDKNQRTCSAGISCAQSNYLKISWNCEMKSWHCWSRQSG